MRRTTQLFSAVIATAFLLQPLINPLSGQESIPKTPAGESLSQLIKMINDDDDDDDAMLAYLKTGFANSDQESLEKRISHSKQVKEQLGSLTFKRAIKSSDNQITAVCDSANGMTISLTITTTDEAPYKVDSIQIRTFDGNEMDDDQKLDADARTQTIQRLASELRSKYVFEKTGEEMAAAIESSMDEGDYDEFDHAQEMASHLTDQLRDICHDKHLRVRAGSPPERGSRPGRRASDNHGFVKVEMLPGGIGYLKFNYFSGEKAAEETASAAMNFLSNSDALIVDLRGNGGGSPKMIAFLTSYLFEEPVHLNSFYNRPTDTTSESWTQENVPGKRLKPGTPVYVLTSSHTFSGAEEFSYNLKNLKRATIVGETTGGGAHPVMPVALGSHFHITMPFARAINPITETNWEGVGVVPHVKVAASDALNKAIELVRGGSNEIASTATAETKMEEKTETSNVKVEDVLAIAQSLMAEQFYEDAAKEFAKVIELDPESGTAWFNLGYCLHASGKLDAAMKIHKKAAKFDRFAGIATYNIACVYSLKNNPDAAFAALEKAIELGFGDAPQVEGDADFDNIRKDARYAKLIEKLGG